MFQLFEFSHQYDTHLWILMLVCGAKIQTFFEMKTIAQCETFWDIFKHHATKAQIKRF